MVKLEEAKSVIERIAGMQPPAEARPVKRKRDDDPPACAPSRRAAVALQVKRNRQAVDDALVASHLGRLELRPTSNSLSAHERMQAVLKKGRSKT